MPIAEYQLRAMLEVLIGREVPSVSDAQSPAGRQIQTQTGLGRGSVREGFLEVEDAYVRV